jgi:hypothetical protein
VLFVRVFVCAGDCVVVIASGARDGGAGVAGWTIGAWRAASGIACWRGGLVPSGVVGVVDIFIIPGALLGLDDGLKIGEMR